MTENHAWILSPFRYENMSHMRDVLKTKKYHSSLREDVVDVLREDNDVIVTTSSLREEITLRTSLNTTVELVFK